MSDERRGSRRGGLAAGAGLLAGLAGCGGLVDREDEQVGHRITDDETLYPETPADVEETTTAPPPPSRDRSGGRGERCRRPPRGF